jgi:PKD repeat protein
LVYRYWRLGAVWAALVVLCALAPTAGAVVVRTPDGGSVGVAPRNGVAPSAIPGSVAAAHGAGAVTASTSGSSWENLNYQGGPVLHSSDPYLIFWAPGGETIPSSWQTLIERYFTDVAADSTRSTNVYGVARQFTDATGFADYRQTFDPTRQVVSDANAYPARDATNCAASPYATCLTDDEIHAEISSLIAADGLPTDGAASATQFPAGAPIYFVVLPSDVDVCFSDGSGICASNDFCAYHDSYVDGADNVLYATIPSAALSSPQDAKSCQWDGNSLVQEPNGSPADVTLKYISHEDNETITDPLLNAWWNYYTGNEDGDNCNDSDTNANAFLPTLGGDAGSGTLYNQLIAADPYYLQSEWSNGDANCEMAPTSGTITPRFGVPAGPKSPGTALTFDPATSTSTNRVSSETWDFGDGTTSFHAGRKLTPATHTYAAPGDYSVTLMLVDNRGNVNTTSEQISVGASPVAAVAASSTQLVEGSGSVSLDAGGSTAGSGSIVSYAWDFGDGSTAQGISTNHTYATAGTYLVRLTVTDSLGGVDTATSTITVRDEPPVAAFTLPASAPEAGQPVHLDGTPSTEPDGSIASYAWSFGDGATATGPAPSHTYPSAVTYPVTLTVTDTSGQKGSITKQLTVVAGPSARLTSSTAQPLEGTSVAFSATGSVPGASAAAVTSYAWTFGDGATATGATASHTYTTAGSYTVQLTVTDSAGASNTTSQKVTVLDEAPTASFTTAGAGVPAPNQAITFNAGGSNDPDGTIASYTWDFGDGTTGTGAAPTHAYGQPGTYTVRLTVRDSAGQTASTSEVLTVHAAPPSSFTYSSALPVEHSATTFIATSLMSDPVTAITSFQWDFGDGTGASGATAVHAYAREGTYTVTLTATDALGLTSTTTERVAVADAAPVAGIAVRRQSGRSVTLTGAPSHDADDAIVSYFWHFGGAAAVGRTVTHTFAKAGLHRVSLTVKDSYGETATTTVTVRAGRPIGLAKARRSPFRRRHHR